MTNYDNFDAKTYLARQAFMSRIIDEKKLNICYLNLYTSRHIYKSNEKFVNLWPKIYKFKMARNDIIRSKQVGTVILFLKNNLEFTLTNIV